MFPAIFAMAMIVAFGVFGAAGIKTASADVTDVEGDTLIQSGTTHAYWACVADLETGDLFAAQLDVDVGKAKITDLLEGDLTSDLVPLVGGPASSVNGLATQDSSGLTTGLYNLLDTYVGDLVADTGDFQGMNGCTGTTNNSIVLVLVECVKPGSFAITFESESDTPSADSLDITCVGPDLAATITALPARVQIVPSEGDVSHSLIYMVITDTLGNPAFPGEEVEFSVDHGCVLGDTDSGFNDALGMFSSIKPNFPTTANDVENLYGGPHFPPLTSTFSTFTDGSADLNGPAPGGAATVAAAILHCDDPGATPGVATVTARISKPGPDIVKTVAVTVVGPPFAVTVSVDKTTVVCGERVTVTAKITDAIGQIVSEHTPAEAISNLGSVLGGTGAVANYAGGPVTPISSTVAETFSGIATFYLLTSDTQDGLYEIVVTSGGSGALGGFLGGWFSTPPVSGFAQVTCSQPAPAAPAIAGPATGTGPLRAPNTGDAGLADSGSSSLMLLAAAAIAFALSGLAVAKFARR
jgi:hypothetical protein